MGEGRMVSAMDFAAGQVLDADVAIVGSGAGGAVLAAGLVKQGLSVVMVEAGGSFSRPDFNRQERWAYPALYQERGGRATADQAITVLQGASVGGGTTINWTTCFRTPDWVLDHWSAKHGLSGWSSAEMAPHFEAVEKRLSIAPWDIRRANANNRKLLDGAKALGWEANILRRNVKNCADTGFCGVGCPMDAKQAMHLTYLPDAVAGGMTLISDAKADRFVMEAGSVTALEVSAIDRASGRPTGKTLTIKAKIFVSSAGAINGPALLMRSGLTDGPVGERTFLHPVVGVFGEYEDAVEGWKGAPQSIGSHQFIHREAGKMGFFMETPPMQPMLIGSASVGTGRAQQELMAKLPNLAAIIGLCQDGILDGDIGGTVSLRGDGRLSIDYPIEAPLIEGFRAAHRAMAQIALAAGAKQVQTAHLDPVVIRTEADLAKIDAAPHGAGEHGIFSAHQMGGCAMGGNAATSVVDPTLRHRHAKNIFVVDGSVFPTSLGVNPSESIYGLAHRAVAFVAAAAKA